MFSGCVNPRMNIEITHTNWVLEPTVISPHIARSASYPLRMSRHVLEKLHFLNSRDCIASFSLPKKTGVRSLLRKSPFAPAAPDEAELEPAAMPEKHKMAVICERESVCIFSIRC